MIEPLRFISGKIERVNAPTGGESEFSRQKCSPPKKLHHIQAKVEQEAWGRNAKPIPTARIPIRRLAALCLQLA